MTFEQAYQQLQEIYETLQSDEVVDVDRIMKLQKEAKKLYEICRAKLKTIK